jgi:hypothetical protein
MLALPALLAVGGGQAAQAYPTTNCRLGGGLFGEHYWYTYPCTLFWYNRSVGVTAWANNTINEPANVCFAGYKETFFVDKVCRWMPANSVREFGITLDGSHVYGGIDSVWEAIYPPSGYEVVTELYLRP